MVDLANLLVQETKAQIYDFAIGVARAIKLPVDTWQPGDPTRSMYHVLAEKLSLLEANNDGYTRSGFVGLAEGDWLKLHASQFYGIDVPGATFASTSVQLTNNGGGYFDIEPFDLTFRNVVTGKTYRNTSGGVLRSGPGTVLFVDVVADEVGSASNAAAGEIADLVTVLLEVSCTNATAAVGVDEQSKEVTREQCANKIAAISPNGPAEAYVYVARETRLTGTVGITRARAYPNSTNGQVLVYLAGPSGAVSNADRSAAESAIVQWANPLCNTPIVASAVPVSVPVTYTLWLYQSVNKSAAVVQSEVQAALIKAFATRDIGGDIIPPANTGALYQSFVATTIQELYPQSFRVLVTLPGGDVALANNQVAVLGAVNGTVVLV
jgi:hypothetical protein